MLHLFSMGNAEEKRSVPFRATRKHHGTEIAEDYTELIDDLIQKTGSARTCDIARALGVSHVTAVKAIKRLARDGYVETAPYKPVTLTKEGQKMARHARRRHELLVEFFVKLGVPRDVAEIDVEGAEHHISKKTLSCIQRFMES